MRVHGWANTVPMLPKGDLFKTAITLFMDSPFSYLCMRDSKGREYTLMFLSVTTQKSVGGRVLDKNNSLTTPKFVLEAVV